MAAMFSKILCGFDFDANSRAALEMAAQLGERNRAYLYALHAVSVPRGALGCPEEPYHRLAQRRKTQLETVMRERVPFAVRWQAIVRIGGNPAEQIISAAENLDAGLIVISTHGRAGVPRLLLGSVAEHVIREATRPVLTVRAMVDPSVELEREVGADTCGLLDWALNDAEKPKLG